MSAWMGLHHPERHRVTAIDGYAECNICGTGCAIDGACRCCLAAEVEALRARNETLIATIQRQDSTFERQMEEHEELEALRAQVARVREAVAYAERNYDAPIVTIGAIKIALDGGDA